MAMPHRILAELILVDFHKISVFIG